MRPWLPSVRTGENFHIVLWLVKDSCWVLNWKWLGIGMVLPTVAMAMYIAWKHRAERYEFLHALATVFWISANSTWMVGEFLFHDSLRSPAIVLFSCGVISVLCHYVPLLFARVGATSTGSGTEQ
ncbi:MAG: hypothetical protein IPG69_11800 [Flavobacteriales bacterium]|jgi:hypothetical protein|nr:hypothetical protein [Flavobacteriales bacterium]MBK9074630.1 hypothetical protein [Flavobacteriales bacterium]